MTQTVLSTSGLGKAYRSYSNEWRRIGNWFGMAARPEAEHWAVRGITFSVARGESVGVVGPNGAGKSTLLKLIAGTLRATEGVVQSDGRIAAILELGMGFNLELTGRQNAWHAAGLMGFSGKEIGDAMSEIEAFSEIGEYFDAPMRTYSSGMQMRVAFSVATAFRPDLLIVDEALAVGDAYFQHKSFERIRAFQNEGTALLIVSHDRNAVQALCHRAILLDRGALIREGRPESVMDYYNALIAEKENSTVEVRSTGNGTAQTISGTGEAKVGAIGLYDESGDAVEFVNVGQAVELRIRARVESPIPRLVLGYMIKDRLGQAVFGTNTWHTDQILTDVVPGSEPVFTIRFAANFGPGSYSVSTALVSSDTHLENNYEWRDLALVFTVANADKAHFVGSAWIPPTIEITR